MNDDIFQSMGTVIQIKTEGEEQDFALAAAKNLILGYEKRFSFFSKESENSKLCEKIHVGEKYQISKELFDMLSAAKKIKMETDGLFDIDHINKESRKDYHLVGNNSIIFDSKKTKLNLGAIAKGYAADKAIEAVREYDIERAMISMGGQVSGFSTKKPWKVGLQNPQKKFGKIFGTLEFTNGSISTSAENYRGKHIKNPAKNDWERTAKCISVFHQSGMLADAFSTALFLADKDLRQKIIQRNSLDVIIINGKNIEITEKILRYFNVNDKQYKIKVLTK